MRLISDIYGARASASKQTFTPPVGVKIADVGAVRDTLLLAAYGMIVHMAGEAGRHPLPVAAPGFPCRLVVAALPSEILDKSCPDHPGRRLLASARPGNPLPRRPAQIGRVISGSDSLIVLKRIEVRIRNGVAGEIATDLHGNQTVASKGWA